MLTIPCRICSAKIVQKKKTVEPRGRRCWRTWCSLHGSPRRRRPRQGWSRGRKGYWSCWDRFLPSRMQMARPSTAPSMPSRSAKEERESSTASAGGPEPLEPRRRRWRREGFGSERDVRWGCGSLRTSTLVRGFGWRVNIHPQTDSSWIASVANCNFAGRLCGFV